MSSEVFMIFNVGTVALAVCLGLLVLAVVYVQKSSLSRHDDIDRWFR